MVKETVRLCLYLRHLHRLPPMYSNKVLSLVRCCSPALESFLSHLSWFLKAVPSVQELIGTLLCLKAFYFAWIRCYCRWRWWLNTSHILLLIFIYYIFIYLTFCYNRKKVVVFFTHISARLKWIFSVPNSHMNWNKYINYFIVGFSFHVKGRTTKIETKINAFHCKL